MKPSVKTHIEILKSCNRTIRKMSALGYLFNRRTGRPRIYIQPNGDSSVGYAYVRGVEERHGVGYYAFSVIINPGGGVINLHGFGFLPAGEMIRKLRALLANPEQMKLHQHQPKV
jgi:hypothetical protein